MKKSVLILFTIFLLPFVAAEELYADVTVSIDETGLLTIDGITNYPPFQESPTEQYTFKKRGYWLLNLSTDVTLSNYVVSVKLPATATINYIKVSGTFRINTDDGLTVITSGNEEPMQILIQYTLGKNEVQGMRWSLVGFAILFVFGVALYFLASQTGNKRKNKLPKDKIELIRQTLTTTQRTIFDSLIVEQSVTQKQLQRTTGIAKSTLSRNLELLARKKIIVKINRGMTNLIKVNDELFS